MTKQYWVIMINGIVVDVENKPKDRMAALKNCIMGTSLSLNAEALWFAENGGSCSLNHSYDITETNSVGVHRMIDDSIKVTEHKLENLKQIKKSLEVQE